MENSTINNDELLNQSAPTEETVKQPRHIRRKAKILFDILILLIAFAGIVISLIDLDTESMLSILKIAFPMLMYIWAIFNRILDIYKQIQ